MVLPFQSPLSHTSQASRFLLQLFALPAVTNLHFVMKKIQNFPLPACPQWCDKQLLRSISRHSVNND